MIADLPSFLRYFQGVHGRTARDVDSLPPEALTWKPPPSTDQESSSWDVPDIVRHIAEGRLFFAGAFLGRGWVWEPWPDDLRRTEDWVPALERSLASFSSMVSEAPERLAARVDPIAGEGRPLSGWRVLMMMVEHEVHHRSQIETYAGLNGWPVNQLFGRTNEWVVSQRGSEMPDRPVR